MSKNSKYIYVAARDDKPARLVFVEQSRFGCAEVRRLRAERGVGPVSRLPWSTRSGFVPSARRA